MSPKAGDSVKQPPFETEDLRRNLTRFLDTDFHGKKVGNYKFGAYAFYDYDGEPIYVGQTNEMLRTRIRRHLTIQRTDAVAMSVLDPFEVCEIEVWPLVQFEGVVKSATSHEKSSTGTWDAATRMLNALEYTLYTKLANDSEFKAILNEKDPPFAQSISVPDSLRGRIVSDEVHRIRQHPDFRIARRASTLARLAQVISERQVQHGLRKTLLTQAKRLQWLAQRRVNVLSPADDPQDDV
jgi:hypothetical protein